MVLLTAIHFFKNRQTPKYCSYVESKDWNVIVTEEKCKGSSTMHVLTASLDQVPVSAYFECCHYSCNETCEMCNI